MHTFKQLHTALIKSISLSPTNAARFFKMQPGQYAHHDQFMGVTMPNIRRIAKEYANTSYDTIQQLLASPCNEERMLALILLVNQYQRTRDFEQRTTIYKLYLDNISHVNNWNLVDASAHHIIGAHLWHNPTIDRSLLQRLAQSPDLWHRRIAIVSSWFFIKKNTFDVTIAMANLLLHDSHDLIHKAVGWMLREVGKKDEPTLYAYLNINADIMPRTMLRYAIERLPKTIQEQYKQ